MKQLLNCVLGLTLITFAGCGKDNNSGKKSSRNQFNFANLINPGIPANGQAVVQKLGSWYSGSSEAQVGQAGTLSRIRYNYSSSQTCTQKSFLGIPYQYCTSSGSNQQGQIVSQQTVALTQDGRAINTKGNTELNAIFSGEAGTLLSAVDVPAYGQSVSQLDFLRSDGTIVSYLIDRGAHSQLNPVRKSESSQSGRIDEVVQFHRIH
jgi:hypothetical protein